MKNEKRIQSYVLVFSVCTRQCIVWPSAGGRLLGVFLRRSSAQLRVELRRIFFMREAFSSFQNRFSVFKNTRGHTRRLFYHRSAVAQPLKLSGKDSAKVHFGSSVGSSALPLTNAKCNGRISEQISCEASSIQLYWRAAARRGVVRCS